MKKTISLVLVIIMLITGMFILTGCGEQNDNGNGNSNSNNANTVEISKVMGKGKFTLSVPKKEDGTPKYEFTETKPEGATVSGTFYLETKNVVMVFSTSGLSYNTAVKYKEKYGNDTKASFDGYLEFIEDTELFNKKINLPGLEQFEINGRKALRYYSRVGSSGDYKYNGYFYKIGVDDIYPGSSAGVLVCYKEEEKPKESKEFDQETLDIISSLKITANE